MKKNDDMLQKVTNCNNTTAEMSMIEAVNFRPKERDYMVMKLIEKNHPVTATDGAAIIRIALEFYWIQHNESEGQKINEKSTVK